MLGIEDGVELGVVIHLHLTVEFEAAFAGQDLLPKEVETVGEIAALLFENREAVLVAVTVGVGSGLPQGLFAGVVDLQGENREPVDDKAGRLGVSGESQFWQGTALSRVSSIFSTRSLRL